MGKSKQMSDILQYHEEYLKGLTIKQLNLKYNIDCNYLFKKYNLKTIPTGDRRVELRNLNNEFNYLFDKITNETEAYIIGLYLADGNTSISQLKIKLQESDKHILEQIKNYINNKLIIRQEGTNFKLVISSKTIVNNAINMGIYTNRKILGLKLPIIDSNLYNHLLRGYFDGDGSVFLDRKYLKCNICSISLEFLKDIQNNLNQFNIESSIYEENRNHIHNANYSMFKLMITKKENIINFYNFLYKDSTIHLTRKKEKFENYVNTELTSLITKGNEVV